MLLCHKFATQNQKDWAPIHSGEQSLSFDPPQDFWVTVYVFRATCELQLMESRRTQPDRIVFPVNAACGFACRAH